MNSKTRTQLACAGVATPDPEEAPLFERGVSIYINNCEIGQQTGDGVVGKHEQNALARIGDVRTIQAQDLRKNNYNPQNDPWLQDYFCRYLVDRGGDMTVPALAHLYGGPYGVTVQHLKQAGIRTIVTMPAHDRALSISEHEIWFGAGSYPFTHIKDDDLWEIYTAHVRECDRVIATSTHAKENIIRDMHVPSRRITVIPHGCKLPASSQLKPMPEKFTVGYMSQAGPDKGILYLIMAWSELGYKDSELILAGDATDSPCMESLIRQNAPNGRFRLLGRVEDPSDVYNACSVMCAPSVTEGCGITILESLAHGRPVISTMNCIGGDAIHDGNGILVPIRDQGAIASAIDLYRQDYVTDAASLSAKARRRSLEYSWSNIEGRYVELYKEVLK